MESRCPICKKPVRAARPENPSAPFCSTRCRDVDLGRWLDGEYRIPVRDALLDAGRATERPSMLPPAPASQPPLATDDPMEGEPAIEVHAPSVEISSKPLPRDP